MGKNTMSKSLWQAIRKATPPLLRHLWKHGHVKQSMEDAMKDDETTTLDPKFCVFYHTLALPTWDEAERKAGRTLTRDQYDDFLRYFRKGIEAQLDWDILKTCALQSAGVKMRS